MTPGTRVTVKAKRPAGVEGRMGSVVGPGEHGRTKVRVEGFPQDLSFLPADLEAYEPRPKELREAEAYAMSTAFIDFDTAEKPRRRDRKHRLAKRAEDLTEGQLAVLVRLLESDAVLCTVGGRSYAVDRVPIGWWVCGLGPDDEEHTVLEDLSACSCPDFRFRERRCKHLEAVTRATTFA